MGTFQSKDAVLHDPTVRVPVGTFLKALFVCLYGYEWCDDERRAYATKRAPHVKAPPTIVVRNALYTFSNTLCGMVGVRTSSRRRAQDVEGKDKEDVDDYRAVECGSEGEITRLTEEKEIAGARTKAKGRHHKDPKFSPADGIFEPRQDQVHKFDISWLEFCACLQQDPFFLNMLHGGAALSEANWTPIWSPTVPLATVDEDFGGLDEDAPQAGNAGWFLQSCTRTLLLFTHFSHSSQTEPF